MHAYCATHILVQLICQYHNKLHHRSTGGMVYKEQRNSKLQKKRKIKYKDIDFRLFMAVPSCTTGSCYRKEHISQKNP